MVRLNAIDADLRVFPGELMVLNGTRVIVYGVEYYEDYPWQVERITNDDV